MSPIKGLSERKRLPRCGKIHLGIKAKTDKGVEYPKAVDYFVFPPEHPQYQELVDTFGEKSRELRIVLPLEDEEKFASQFYRCYSRSRGLICKGDGETAMRTVDVQTGALADHNSQFVEMREVPCQGRECPDYKTKCRETMNLQFLLPEISGLGIWQIDTSSINSILNINGCISLIRAVHGRISMLPLILALEQIEVINPDDGKKKHVWVLNLKSPGTLVEAARQAMMKPLQLIAGMGQEVETPVPDEERPELIAPDWEGEPPDLEQAEKDAEDLWPEDAPHARKAAQTTAVAEPIPSQAEPVAEEKTGFIDTEWLNEQLKILRAKKLKAWSESNLLSYMKTTYKVEAKTVLAAVAKLDEGAANHFVKKIQDTLQMV